MYAREWDLVDVFTVEQAACLWCGVQPRTILSFGSIRQSEEDDRLSAVLQVLVSAIESKKLQVDSGPNALNLIGDHRNSRVNRDALVTFCETGAERPAFLFNTLVRSDDNLDRPSKAAPDSGKIEEPSVIDAPPKNKGGRPREYDWDAFTIEIIRVANLDGLPDSQAELVRHMLEWCLHTWGKEPAESSVKNRISKIYNALTSSQ